MNDLIKFYENENDTTYTINSNGQQGLVSIPKVLNNNIKVFMFFKDSLLRDDEKQQLMFDIQAISQKINKDNDEGMLIVSLMSNDFLINEDEMMRQKELENIKNLVNNIYNKLLSDGKLRKENFVKKIELISLDSKYNNFVNWLCSQNPSKFHNVSYQELLKKEDNKDMQNSVFINQNVANIFNEPNRQSTMMGMQSNVKPISESLSIGTPKIENINQNGQYFGYSGNLANPKTLVRKMPNNNNNNAAFIKWYTTLFILVLSLVVGIAISFVLVS